MDFLHDFDAELKILMLSLEESILNYPDYFKEDAAKFLSAYNILDTNFNKNHLSFLLPYWIKKPLNLNDEACSRISRGFIPALFYFLVQDSVMDTVPGEYKGDRLPLGNLFLLDFLEQYRALFSSGSSFWKYFNCYFTQWANSVTWEQREYMNQSRVYSKEDLLLVAQKAAPLKIITAAACILSEKPEFIHELSSTVDHLVITFQMMDDLSDWKEDILQGNCTYFLSLVMEYCNIRELSSINSSHVRDALFFGDVLDKILKVAEENYEFIVNTTSHRYPYLEAYHISLYNQLKSFHHNISEKKSNKLQGGFIDLLNKAK